MTDITARLSTALVEFTKGNTTALIAIPGEGGSFTIRGGQ